MRHQHAKQCLCRLCFPRADTGAHNKIHATASGPPIRIIHFACVAKQWYFSVVKHCNALLNRSAFIALAHQQQHTPQCCYLSYQLSNMLPCVVCVRCRSTAVGWGLSAHHCCPSGSKLGTRFSLCMRTHKEATVSRQPGNRLCL
jgi:hypothetical protein